jgi:hypothetical protein
MLQVFHIDVTKVDRDVVHVATVFLSVCSKCFICFKRMLQLFYLDVTYTCMLQANVSSVLSISYVCCKYLDDAYVLQWL